MRKLFFVLIFLLFTIIGHAQYGGTVQYQGVFASDPPCTRLGQFYFNSGTSRMRVCTATGNPGIWIEQGTGGATSPGGSDTQLQRNNAGAFGGISGATSDGTNLTAGSGNLRATRPRITTGIDDANGAQIIGFTPTASADNYVNITNHTGDPTISVAGADTDISLNINSKGTNGSVTITTGSGGLLNTNAAALNLTAGFLSVRNASSTYVDTGTAGNSFVAIRSAIPRLNAVQGSGIGFGESGSGTATTGLNTSSAGLLLLNDGSATLTNYRDMRLRGLQLSTGTRPTCDSTTRGFIWYVAGGAGVADTLEVCKKDAGDSYAWTSLF